MRYEEMTFRNLPDLAAIYVEAYNAPPWNDQWSEELALARMRRAMTAEAFYGLVAMNSEDRPIGLFYGHGEIYYAGDEFFIEEFLVRPSSQRQGVGTKLLQEAESHLSEKGYEKIYLFTSKREETQGYYQRRGFIAWEGMTLMGKDIAKM